VIDDFFSSDENGITLARRLAVVLVASAAVLLFFNLISCAATLAFIAWASRFGLTDSLRVTAAMVMTLLSLGIPVMLYMILRRWRRKIDAGISLWFTRWAPGTMAVVILTLLVLQHLVPRAYPGPLLSFSPYTSWAWVGFALFTVGTMLYLAVGCFIWLWWCVPTQDTPRALEIAFWAWITIQTLGFLVPSMEMSVCLSLDEPPLSGMFNHLTLLEHPLRGNALTWFIRWEAPGLIRLYMAVPVFGLFLFTGYMGREARRFINR